MGSSTETLDHRAFVGPRNRYGTLGAHQFCTLVGQGLRENHTLLDIGCGSLRAGRFFMVYLNAGNYHGIEPNKEVLKLGLEKEIPNFKDAQFTHSDQFEIPNQKFDFILAHSIFIHTCKEQIKLCINNVAKVMDSETKFLATYKAGTTEWQGDKWSYPNPVHYVFDTFKELATLSELSVTELDTKHLVPGHRWILFRRKQ